ARKVAARGLALSVAAVAALSVSGVAAAVNGDPLSPYEKVIEGVVNVVRPKTTLPVEKLDGLVIGSKAKMVAAENDYVTRHKDAKHGDEGDGTQAFSRLDPLQHRDLARPLPPVDVRPAEPSKTVTPVTPTTTETTAGDEKSTPTEPTSDQTTTETTPPQSTETTDTSNQPTSTETPTNQPTSDTTTQPSDTSTTTPTGSSTGDEGGAESTDDSTTGSVPADPVATAEQVTATLEQVAEAATEALEQVATTVDAGTSHAHTARHAAPVPVDSAGGISDPALRAAVGHGSLAAHAR
ncbi:MAG TPA: hypothetical protein VEK80_13370, partial [Kribbellaceae bacterium]|nr:hypothetical protein [Kribbellaceae bacterium]